MSLTGSRPNLSVMLTLGGFGVVSDYSAVPAGGICELTDTFTVYYFVARLLQGSSKTTTIRGPTEEQLVAL